MLRRPYKDGWFMITQPTHAWSAGQMARVWGNDALIPPHPTEAVFIATSLHDVGWTEWDALPRLAADGYPVNYDSTMLTQTHDFWKRAVAHIQQFDPYSGLLVSMHAAADYQNRIEREIDPPNKHSEILQTIAGLEELQENLKDSLQRHPLYADSLDDNRIQANYEILRSCDLLCLVLCEDDLAAGEIPNVPGASLDDRVTIACTPQDAFTLALKPYPFHVKELRIRLPGRYITQKTYTNTRLFQGEFENAAWEVLEFTLVPA